MAADDFATEGAGASWSNKINDVSQNIPVYLTI